MRAASTLYAVPQAELAPAARQRIEARVQDRLRTLPAPRRAPAPAVRRSPVLGLLRWASTVALTVLILSVVTGGAIRASGSLPGEPLYSLKSVQEQVKTWLTPSDERADMHLAFAERRLEEIMVLGHLGIVDDLGLIQMESEMRQAIELLPTLADGQKRQVAQKALALSKRQSVILSSLRYYTPRLSQAGLEWGVETAEWRVRMLQEVLKNGN